jgi:hypothetical protein
MSPSLAAVYHQRLWHLYLQVVATTVLKLPRHEQVRGNVTASGDTLSPENSGETVFRVPFKAHVNLSAMT